MVEVEEDQANESRKSIYVTVRVNSYVLGPMETRNKNASQEVCQSKGLRESLQETMVSTPKYQGVL